MTYFLKNESHMIYVLFILANHYFVNFFIQLQPIYIFYSLPLLLFGLGVNNDIQY